MSHSMQIVAAILHSTRWVDAIDSLGWAACEQNAIPEPRCPWPHGLRWRLYRHVDGRGFLEWNRDCGERSSRQRGALEGAFGAIACWAPDLNRVSDSSQRHLASSELERATTRQQNVPSDESFPARSQLAQPCRIDTCRGHAGGFKQSACPLGLPPPPIVFPGPVLAVQRAKDPVEAVPI